MFSFIVASRLQRLLEHCAEDLHLIVVIKLACLRHNSLRRFEQRLHSFHLIYCFLSSAAIIYFGTQNAHRQKYNEVSFQL